MLDFNKIWKQHITEISRLPKKLYSALRRSLKYSRFWTLPNDPEDITKKNATPAALAIEHELNKLSYNLDLGVYFMIISEGYIDPEMPNKIVAGASFGVEDNVPVIQVMLEISDYREFEHLGFDKDKAIEYLSTILNHELIHFQQLKSQAQNKGIELQAAFDQMIDDPRQVVDTDNLNARTMDEYFPIYLTRHIEEEAHAHQTAEELYKKFGKDKAMAMISKAFKMGDPGPLEGYALHVPPEKQKRFRSKVYQYLNHFEDEDIFDTKPKPPDSDPSGGRLEID